MKGTIFVETGRIALDEKPIPDVGPLDALVRVTTTTICGTDVHIMREYPVARGLTIGHEVDVAIDALGTQATFEAAFCVLRSGGSMSSLGVYSSDLKIQLGAFAARTR